jgi:hypothetical protein
VSAVHEAVAWEEFGFRARQLFEGRADAVIARAKELAQTTPLNGQQARAQAWYEALKGQQEDWRAWHEAHNST